MAPSFVLPHTAPSTASLPFGADGFSSFPTTHNGSDGCCTPPHQAFEAFPQQPASLGPSNLLEALRLQSPQPPASTLWVKIHHGVLLGEKRTQEKQDEGVWDHTGFLQTLCWALCTRTPHLAPLWKAQGSTSCQKKHPARHSMLWSYAIPVPTMHRWARDHLQAWSPAPELIRAPVRWHRACSGCGKGACRRANATGRSTSANQRAASNQHSGALAGPVQDTSHRLTPGTLQSPRNPWIPQFKVEGWYQLHKAAPIFQSLV